MSAPPLARAVAVAPAFALALALMLASFAVPLARAAAAAAGASATSAASTPVTATATATATPAAATITCPPTLVETPVVSSLLSGWEVEMRAGRRTLSDAAVHVSRGSDRGAMPPEVTTQSGHEESDGWTLSAGEGRVYWVACSYGNTSALLLQRIPDAASHCVATHDVLTSGRHLNVRPVRCD